MTAQTSRVDRTERLLNLVICLMAARVPVHRSTIRSAIPGYADASSDTAFERMFERDKDELRAMGVPIETVTDAHGDVLGYRVHPEDYELPAVSFSPQERAVLAVAATLWEETTLGPTAIAALRKLDATQQDASAPVGQVPQILVRNSDVATFALPLMRALRERRTTQFLYRAAGETEERRRTVDPWGVVARDGAWYLIGHDRERGDPRVFRLSRIVGAIEVCATPVDVAVPDNVDLARLIAPGAEDESVTARVEVQAGRGAELRRHALSIRQGSNGQGSNGHGSTERGSSSAEVVVQARTREQLVTMLCAAGDGARVLPDQGGLDREVMAGWAAALRRHESPFEPS